MAKHIDNKKILEEALQDALKLVKIGIDSEKEDGGCLGYPSAILLFSIVDTLGSYLRESKYEIYIDGQKYKIKENSTQHFFILNSHYFNLNYSINTIEAIYKAYRCKLTHNSSLPLNHVLSKGEINDEVILFANDTEGNPYPFKINLLPFFNLCQKAVEMFLHDIKSPSFHAKVFEELYEKAKTPKDFGDIVITTTNSAHTPTLSCLFPEKFDE